MQRGEELQGGRGQDAVLTGDRLAEGFYKVIYLLLIAVGIMQVSGIWAALIIHLQVLVAGWQTPL